VKVGDLVREVERDPAWILYGDTPGVIIRAADDDMGLVARPAFGKIHHWLVSWGNGDFDVMNISDIEVIHESR
jgi:hypothetical protein